MAVAPVILLVLSYVISTNQNNLSFIHDFDLNATATTDEKKHNKNKRSNGPFDELANYNKLDHTRKNLATFNELWKNNPDKNEEPHSFLYICGDDDPTDISCYNDLEDDGLKIADNDTTFPAKNIFFIDASCQMGLNVHQVCSIESAARANPAWQVSVLFAGRLPKHCQRTTNLTALERYSNIYFYRIYTNTFTDGTPLHNFFNSNALDNSLHPVYHSTEILKYLTLNKWGGVYLDTNMVVVKSFKDLPLNWIARENEDELGTAAMALTRDNTGGLISKAAIRVLAKTFCVSKYCANGFGAITQALNETCRIYNVARQWKSRHCPGFRILESKYFYPLEHFIEHQYSDKHFKFSEAHTFHIWSKTIPEESLPFYKKLAKKYCPQAFKYLASGINQRTYFENEISKSRLPPMLVTESLAEPLKENVRPPTTETNEPKTNPEQIEPRCKNKHNGTACSLVEKTQEKKKIIKKPKKNKVSSKKMKSHLLKTKLLKDAKKPKIIETRKQMLKRNVTSTTTEEAIIVNFDLYL